MKYNKVQEQAIMIGYKPISKSSTTSARIIKKQCLASYSCG